MTQREPLEWVVEHELESPDALVDSFRTGSEGDDEFEGLSDEEIERWLSGTSASGDPIEEDDIDRILYEEEDAPGFESE